MFWENSNSLKNESPCSIGNFYGLEKLLRYCSRKWRHSRHSTTLFLVSVLTCQTALWFYVKARNWASKYQKWDLTIVKYQLFWRFETFDLFSSTLKFLFLQDHERFIYNISQFLAVIGSKLGQMKWEKISFTTFFMSLKGSLSISTIE